MENKNMEKEIKKKKTIMIILIIIGIFLVAGGTYALLYEMFNGTNTNTIKTGTIRFVYTEPDNSVSVTNVGLTDEEVMSSNDYFEFNIESRATGKTKVGYYIYLTYDENNTIPKKAIKVGLTSTNGPSTSIADETLLFKDYYSNLLPFNTTTLDYDTTSNNYVLYKSEFNFMTSNTLQTHHYRLRLWYDLDYFNNYSVINNNEGTHEINTTNGTFKVKINVYGMDGEAPTISDNVNPICSNLDTSVITTEDTAIYEFTCTDISYFDNSNIVENDFNITGDISITNIVKSNIENGYKYIITLAIGSNLNNATLQLKAGTITDINGNANEALNHNIIKLN